MLAANTIWGKRARFGCLILAGLLVGLPPLATSRSLAITAVSVGQGESILISRGGDHYLVDGGGLHSDFFDVGERLVAPALGRLGVRGLEAVILTHDHPDHRKGLIHVLDHFPVKAFWSSIPWEKLHPSLQQVLSDRQIPLLSFAPGWTFPGQAADQTLAVYAPDQTGPLNDRSLVVYVRCGGDGALLTGDLEAAGVARLVENAPKGPVNLLKLPHHGSRHSAPERLLEHFAPEQVFACVGAGNSYRLPHHEVVREISRRGLVFYRTDLHGSLKFVSDGSGWRVERWERGLFR